jgi:predicted regulator of Ras-like GTPase activity (Roadblock/LC7/MglB family)
VTQEEFSVSADDLGKKVKELLHEGNVTRIIIKDEQGKVLLEIPATVGVIGVVLAPWLAALGVIAALATNCRIIVERRE